MATSKSVGIWPDARLVSSPNFKLIALKRFEFALETKFDIYYFSDSENQGRDAKTNDHTEGPILFNNFFHPAHRSTSIPVLHALDKVHLSQSIKLATILRHSVKYSLRQDFLRFPQFLHKKNGHPNKLYDQYTCTKLAPASFQKHHI